MIDDAKLVFAGCAYARRSGCNLNELHSWRELEQSIAKHGGTVQFKVRPDENTNLNKQLNTPSEQKHSKTGAFSIAEKGGKFTAKIKTMPQGNEKRLANIASLYHGKANGDTYIFDNEGDRVEFIHTAETYLKSTDPNEKIKASIDAWHGNGLYELIDKFTLIKK